MVQTRQDRRAAKGKAVMQEEGPSMARGRPSRGRGRSAQGPVSIQEPVLAQEGGRERVLEMGGRSGAVPGEGVGPSGGNATSGVGQREDAMANLLDQLLRTQQQQAAA